MSFNTVSKPLGVQCRTKWNSFRSKAFLHTRAVKTEKKNTNNSNTSSHTTKSNSDNGSTGAKSISEPFNPISWYTDKLETYPLLTKCITSGIISGSGDLICQYIVHKHDEENVLNEENSSFTPDWIRTGRFSLLGFGLVAPVVHNWYGLLMSRIPGQSTLRVLQRLFYDQVLFAPLFISTFMTSLMALEGKKLNDVPQVLERDLGNIIVSNWALWVPAMYVNFRFVPVQWQVLYSNCVGLVWNTYLSWKTQDDADNSN